MRLVLFVASTLLLSASHAAAGKAKKAERTTAVFPVLSQGAPETMVAKLNGLLLQTLPTTSLNVLQGDALEQRLKVAPSVAAERCAGEPACMARHGKTAKAFEVVFGYAGATKSGVTRIELVVVNTQSGRIERRAKLEVTKPEQLEPGLKKIFDDVFKTPYPDSLEMPPLEDLSSPDALPLAPLTEKAAPVAAGPEVTAITAAPATSATVPSAVPPAPARRPYLVYAGIGVAALGALSVGFGTYNWIDQRSLFSDAEAKDKNGNKLVSQPEAVRLQQQIDDKYDRAVLFDGIGIGAIVLGAGMIAADVLWLRAPSVNVTVTPTGARTSVVLSF